MGRRIPRPGGVVAGHGCPGPCGMSTPGRDEPETQREADQEHRRCAGVDDRSAPGGVLRDGHGHGPTLPGVAGGSQGRRRSRDDASGGGAGGDQDADRAADRATGGTVADDGDGDGRRRDDHAGGVQRAGAVDGVGEPLGVDARGERLDHREPRRDGGLQRGGSGEEVGTDAARGFAAGAIGVDDRAGSADGVVPGDAGRQRPHELQGGGRDHAGLLDPQRASERVAGDDHGATGRGRSAGAARGGRREDPGVRRVGDHHRDGLATAA